MELRLMVPISVRLSHCPEKRRGLYQVTDTSGGGLPPGKGIAANGTAVPSGMEGQPNSLPEWHGKKDSSGLTTQTSSGEHAFVCMQIKMVARSGEKRKWGLAERSEAARVCQLQERVPAVSLMCADSPWVNCQLRRTLRADLRETE